MDQKEADDIAQSLTNIVSYHNYYWRSGDYGSSFYCGCLVVQKLPNEMWIASISNNHFLNSYLSAMSSTPALALSNMVRNQNKQIDITPTLLEITGNFWQYEKQENRHIYTSGQHQILLDIDFTDKSNFYPFNLYCKLVNWSTNGKRISYLSDINNTFKTIDEDVLRHRLATQLTTHNVCYNCKSFHHRNCSTHNMTVFPDQYCPKHTRK